MFTAGARMRALEGCQMRGLPKLMEHIKWSRLDSGLDFRCTSFKPFELFPLGSEADPVCVERERVCVRVRVCGLERRCECE